jgi:phosphohistidine swiveling domain-containing protein
MFGQAPEDIHVPIHPLSRSDIIQEILPGLWRVITNMLKATFTVKRFLRETPDWCREMTTRIEQIETKEALLALWQSKLQPYTIKAWWGHTAGATGVLNIMTLERKLTKLVGKEDANLLLSNLRGDTGLASVAKGAHLREAARSEFTRVFRVVRAFALRAGELTGIGEDVFFLYIDEVLALLAGNDKATQFIPARQENYERYKSLPQFPSIIRGRFNPLEWAKDGNRRIDYYDPTRPIEAPESDVLKGIPGAAGRVEGRVRILLTPEEGEKLQPGEILVAATTNVGWTPLFPKAAAIITDIGAPLSHAAIVARELGIPAVVGCGQATTRLKTGDRVIVDGGQGVVHIQPY